MASTTGNDITTLYRQTYPGELDDNGEWLAVRYAVKFDDLKAMVAGVEACVEASGETPSEKQARKVTIPRGADGVVRVCKLAHQIARCDRRFGTMTAAELAAVQDIGTVQRVARQARCIIDHRPFDVAYWRARVVTWMGGQQGQGQGRVPSEAGAAEGAAAVPAGVLETGGTGEHEVAAVVGKRETAAGGLEYRVQWSGTTEESWEPIHHLYGSMVMVAQYEVAQDAAQGEPEAQRGVPEARQRQGSAGWGGEAMAACMTTVMEAQERLMQQLQQMGRGAGGSADAGAGKQKADDRCPWDRPVLKGDERRIKVGREMFDKERQLKRVRAQSEMAHHLPFAEMHNKEMEKSLRVEGRMLDQERQRDLAQKRGDEIGAAKAQARYEVLHDQWVVLEDRGEFIRGCSDLARQGKWVVAQQMLDDMETDAEETSANAEFKKRRKAAEECLRKEAEIDRGVLVAAQLGETAAFRGGQHQLLGSAAGDRSKGAEGS